MSTRQIEQKLATLLGWRETCARTLSGEIIWRTPEGTTEMADWTRNPDKAHALLGRFNLSIDRQPDGVLVSHEGLQAFAAYHEHPCPEEALLHAIVTASSAKLELGSSEQPPACTIGRLSATPGGL